MAKRIYRKTSDKMIAGVCSGIADYCNLDPTIVRLLWLLISFCGGAGILAYLICMLVIPADTDL